LPENNFCKAILIAVSETSFKFAGLNDRDGKKHPVPDSRRRQQRRKRYV
jgi:hypothetical protein